MNEQTREITASSLRCAACGYDLTGAMIGGVCPECGTSVERSLQARGEPPSCGAATACMVFGILSLVVCGVLGPVAIILYVTAIREMNRSTYARASHTMATAGLVMGIISTSIMVIFALIVLGASL